MAFIEPCCCERQLPRLLREQRMAFFQSSGDVTVKHLMKSVGCMVKNRSTMWLVAPSVDRDLLKLIRYWISREWIARVKIITRDACDDVVTSELGVAVVPHDTVVEYGQDESLSVGLLAFEDDKSAVVLQGDMLVSILPGIKLYSGCFGASESDCVKGVMDVVRAFVKSRAKILDKDATEPQPAEKKVSTEKRKRKTARKG